MIQIHVWILPVTPLAGVWIEIVQQSHLPLHQSVTPLAGVWIEMLLKLENYILD